MHPQGYIMKTTTVSGVNFVLCLLLAGTAAAHHSPAAFDRTKEVRIEGTVTKFAFNNPHTYLTVEVIASDGTRRLQEIEAGPISTIQPLGLTRDSLRIGERVVVRASPGRRGSGHTVLGLDVTRADGKVFPLNISSASVRPPTTAVATSLAGTWRPTLKGFEALAQAIGSSWPLTEEGRQGLAETRRANFTTQSECIPAGAPMLMVYPVATTVEVTDSTVVFDIDWLGAKRVVQLDAARHPPGLQPTLQGHSIGRWEGGTLVVDTAGFAPHAEGIGFGMPSSEGKRLVERFTLADDRRHLRYEVTVEDPRYLTQPVSFNAQWEYSPDLRPSGVECDLEVARRYLLEADLAAEPRAASEGAATPPRPAAMLGPAAMVMALGVVIGVLALLRAHRRRR